MLLFSTHKIKFVWYLPKQSKISFYFILFQRTTGNETTLQKLTFFLTISCEFSLVQRVHWVYYWVKHSLHLENGTECHFNE